MLSKACSERLKKRINEVFGSERACARAIGMVPETLNLKTSGLRELKLSDVLKLCDVLHINPGKEFLNFFYD
ncbi:MAG: hypothetical protein ACI4J7_05855 [Ruminiclostridium sp.]